MEQHVCDDRFIRMAQVMGMADAGDPMDFIIMLTKLQEDCGVADLKMSEYGIKPYEFETLAKNAMDTMGGLFAADPCPLTAADCVSIFEKSYR